MFRSQYHYTLDDKGRVVLPPRYRRELGDTVVVTRSITDPAIWVYPMKAWEELEQRLSQLPASRVGLQRFLVASARDVEIDRQGRIMLPEVLRQYAGIDRDVVVIGNLNRLEIWSEARWAELVAKEGPEAARALQELDIRL